MSYANLLPSSWRTTVSEWIKEDVPSFDYGGFVVGGKSDVARLLGKTPVRLFIMMCGVLNEMYVGRAVRAPVRG